MQSTKIGDIGEQIALEELVRSGYLIVGRNWKTKVSEIDIIAKRANFIYFVEVKYRSSLKQGDGFDYITPKKLHHMQRAAELWVVQNNWTGEYGLMAAAVNGATKEVDIREI